VCACPVPRLFFCVLDTVFLSFFHTKLLSKEPEIAELMACRRAVLSTDACHFFSSIKDPEIAELMACRRAVHLAKEVGVQKLILQSDSQNAVHKISGGVKDLSSHGPIVEEVKGLLQSFEDSRVVLRRTANKVTHDLAREGCRNKLCKTWFQVPPAFVSSVVAPECTMKI
jgi:hypothetical protein